MPRLKRKSVLQRNVAMRSLMRSRRSARDVIGDGNGTGAGSSVADEGRDDPTDLIWSVPIMTASAVRQSVQGAYDKQMEVQARLFKPSGPSVLESLLDSLLDDLLVDLLKELLNELSNEMPNITLLDNVSNDTAELELVKVHKDSSSISEPMDSDPDQNKSFVSDRYRNDRNNAFNWKTLIFGSYSQSNSKFSVYSRGSQCTIISLCALIYAHYSSLSSKLNVDEVLVTGDQLYQNVLQNLKQQGKFKHRLLCLDEIPDEVNILCRQVHIEKESIISGVAVELDSSLPSLHQSLHSAFLSAQYVLVMIGAVCSAVFAKDDKFWLFDSHSHGNHGMSSPDGKSLLISFGTLDDIVTFMYAMYESMKIDLSSQFEILPVKFTSLDNRGSSFSSLLMKYFEDQRIKTDTKSNVKCIQKNDSCCNEQGLSVVESRNVNRKEYFKKYRQAKRTDLLYKEKEKKIQTASKQNARANLEYASKERESKHMARGNAEFRIKEKAKENALKRKARNDRLFNSLPLREVEIIKQCTEI